MTASIFGPFVLSSMAKNSQSYLHISQDFLSHLMLSYLNIFLGPWHTSYSWPWTWTHDPEDHFEVLSWLSLHLPTLLSLRQEGAQVKDVLALARWPAPPSFPVTKCQSLAGGRVRESAWTHQTSSFGHG